MAVLDLDDIKKIQKARVKRFWDFLDEAGRVDLSPRYQLGPFNGIKDCWKNEPCIVVATGPSLKDFDLNRIQGVHSIGINHIIEDYDKFEWFFFLDQRFLNRTTYNIRSFNGKIFCQNTCSPPPGLNVVKFKTLKNRQKLVSLDIAKGLYNGCLSGLSALHLALIAGAKPIYLIGFDCGGGDFKNYHYKKEYTGATHNQEKYIKYKKTAGYFESFKPWAGRIINLSQISTIKTFKKVNVDTIPLFKLKPKVKVQKKVMEICHIIAMKDMSEMGDISRQVYNLGKGRHTFCNIENKPPKADIYLLECFINKSKKFVNFQKPYPNSKVISIIHSSSVCMPATISDKVVTLTKAWQQVIQRKKFPSVVIPAGIDINNYRYIVDYSKKTFGRITRYSPGKVHPQFNQVALNILKRYPNSKCIVYSNKSPKWLKHDRFIVDNSIKIYEHEKKAQKLSQLTIFADAHNTFQETFSLALLEAMAAGLCCVMYSKNPNPAMKEVLGNTGIWCNSIEEFQRKIIELLPYAQVKKEWGKKAKNRAFNYSIDNMIRKYNQLFEEVLK
jgi:glycosyltransferase involved in cell wall biosynthesis